MVGCRPRFQALTMPFRAIRNLLCDLARGSGRHGFSTAQQGLGVQTRDGRPTPPLPDRPTVSWASFGNGAGECVPHAGEDSRGLASVGRLPVGGFVFGPALPHAEHSRRVGVDPAGAPAGGTTKRPRTPAPSVDGNVTVSQVPFHNAGAGESRGSIDPDVPGDRVRAAGTVVLGRRTGFPDGTPHPPSRSPSHAGRSQATGISLMFGRRRIDWLTEHGLAMKLAGHPTAVRSSASAELSLISDDGVLRRSSLTAELLATRPLRFASTIGKEKK